MSPNKKSAGKSAVAAGAESPYSGATSFELRQGEVDRASVEYLLARTPAGFYRREERP
jgi:hypothetical protein